MTEDEIIERVRSGIIARARDAISEKILPPLDFDSHYTKMVLDWAAIAAMAAYKAALAEEGMAIVKVGIMIDPNVQNEWLDAAAPEPQP